MGNLDQIILTRSDYNNVYERENQKRKSFLSRDINSIVALILGKKTPNDKKITARNSG